MKKLLFTFLLIPVLLFSQDHGSQSTFQNLKITNTNWDDIRVSTGAFQFLGGADPTLVSWQPGASGETFSVFAFQKNDKAFATTQLPHGYKLGTDLEVHIHWTPKDRGNEEADSTVGWKVHISVVSIGGVFPSSTTYDLSDTVTDVDDKHEITSSVTVSGTGLGLSSVINTIVTRTDTGADDTWVGTTTAQSPVLLEIDFHYEIDQIGSNEELSK